MLPYHCCSNVCNSIAVLLYIDCVHAGHSHKTPATELPAKKARSRPEKVPASAHAKHNVPAAVDGIAPVATTAVGRTPMEPATEAKKLRQLCKLLRAELAAKVNSAAPRESRASCTGRLSH